MNQITTSQSFKEKMKDKIREGLDDLLGDAELEKLIRKGIEDTFFQPRTVKTGPYSTKELPPQILAEWVQNHDKEILEEFKKVSSEQLVIALQKSIADIFQNSFDNLRWAIQNDLQNFMNNH